MEIKANTQINGLYLPLSPFISFYLLVISLISSLNMTFLTRYQPLLRWQAPFLLLLALLLIFFNCKREVPYRVLVLHSHEQQLYNYRIFNEEIEKQFRRLCQRSVDITYYYVDCERHNPDSEEGGIRNCLDAASVGNRPDVILVNDDQAFYSFLKVDHPLAHEVPVVFAGVAFPNQKLMSRYDNLTGSTHVPDLAKVLEVGYELTGCRHGYSLTEYTALDRLARVECKRQMKEHPNIVDNLDWKYRLVELREQLPDSLFSFTSFSISDVRTNTHEQNAPASPGFYNLLFVLGQYSDMVYVQLKFDSASRTLNNFHSNAQVTATYHNFGRADCNLMGGYFASEADLALDQVQRAVRILQGERPSDIPITPIQKHYYADWPRLKAYGLHIDDIPERYTVIHAGFKDYHPILHALLLAVGVLAFMSLFVFLLQLYLIERRRKLKLARDHQRERSMMKLALANNHTFVWQLNDESLTFEESFWNYIGEKIHSMLHQEFLQFIHPDSLQAFEEGVSRIHEGGEHTYEVLCDFERDGHYSWWQVRSSSYHDSMGHLRCVGLLFDIDLLKKREEELIRARQLAEKAELKEAFLANMSHEIRTPLNAIVGFSNILATPGMELSEEDKAEFIETINKNNDLLLKLVNDVLDLSRIETDYVSMQPTHIAVHRMMEYIYQSYLVQAPKHLEFRFVQGPDHLAIYADEGRVEQVLTNFLTNAAKFTSQGHIALGWAYDKRTTEVELYVEDTGIGLTEEQQQHVFDRFYKVNEFKQGTGLGLSICKVIADKLHGRITVSSVLGQGSRFSFWLRTV